MTAHEVNDVSVPGLQTGDWDTEKWRNFPQGLTPSALEPRFKLRQSGLTLQYNTTYTSMLYYILLPLRYWILFWVPKLCVNEQKNWSLAFESL